MNLVFACEPIMKAWPEARELMLLNNEETGFFPKEDFAPQVEKYQIMEAIGQLSCLTARHNGVLIGYSVFIVSDHILYPSKKVATQEYLYVDKKHRGISAFRFLQFTEEYVKFQGCHYVCRMVSKLPSAPDYSRTLERMGYRPLEASYIKSLGVC